MIQALKREQPPTTLSDEALGEMQTQMLMLGGAAAEHNRVELITKMALRHVNGEEGPRPWYERQKFIIDVFADDLTFSAFRYELTADEGRGRMGCELEVRPWPFEPGSDQDDGLEFFDAKDEPTKVLGMLQRAIAVGADTTNWPPRPYEVRPDNPVLGKNYGMNDALLRPRALFPVLGSIMGVGAELLKNSGDGSASEVRIDINAGKQFYDYGYYGRERQHVILWAQNHDAQASFAVHIKPYGGDSIEQVAFVETELVVDEFGFGGDALRRTISRVHQFGDGLQLSKTSKYRDKTDTTTEDASLETITELARQVGQHI